MVGSDWDINPRSTTFVTSTLTSTLLTRIKRRRKTDRHDIIDILLKVALNPIQQNQSSQKMYDMTYRIWRNLWKYTQLPQVTLKINLINVYLVHSTREWIEDASLSRDIPLMHMRLLIQIQFITVLRQRLLNTCITLQTHPTHTWYKYQTCLQPVELPGHFHWNIAGDILIIIPITSKWTLKKTEGAAFLY